MKQELTQLATQLEPEKLETSLDFATRLEKAHLIPFSLAHQIRSAAERLYWMDGEWMTIDAVIYAVENYEPKMTVANRKGISLRMNRVGDLITSPVLTTV